MQGKINWKIISMKRFGWIEKWMNKFNAYASIHKLCVYVLHLCGAFIQPNNNWKWGYEKTNKHQKERRLDDSVVIQMISYGLNMTHTKCTMQTRKKYYYSDWLIWKMFNLQLNGKQIISVYIFNWNGACAQRCPTKSNQFDISLFCVDTCKCSIKNNCIFFNADTTIRQTIQASVNHYNVRRN